MKIKPGTCVRLDWDEISEDYETNHLKKGFVDFGIVKEKFYKDTWIVTALPGRNRDPTFPFREKYLTPACRLCNNDLLYSKEKGEFCPFCE